MKTPNLNTLIKFLLLTKQSKLKSQSNFHKNEAGFSLIEVVVVVLMVAILSAIAAPGWLGFVNRQRIYSLNDEVYRTIQNTQSEAKHKKLAHVVEFDGASDPPRFRVYPITVTAKTEQDQFWQPLSVSGSIKEKQVKLVSNMEIQTSSDPDVKTDQPDDFKNQYSKNWILVFNQYGEVVNKNGKTPVNDVPFTVTVSLPDGTSKRCVMVETLLGGMRTAEKTDCPTPP
ncbi:Tfp pilus assembly protein FimT/FimU [Planktothrix agardhii]|uniref:pilus assembly FimT family protein n=1 Tax=Planktothrix agardhii TaxID=1160 RepID=UPI001D09DCE0|nr:prepilin-type N-terminal cleavage/methylation domain-containing protein [Planktothrix agardhii]MCB8788402.1 prepilin-type N-terminal cleavage/methylation domain-containing protein [Planktothrix agardhii 1025]MCF3609822.1 prepilin-type N-terminal cleavage/methylation domain-containing protein [Planktothrix agardhii 1027]